MHIKHFTLCHFACLALSRALVGRSGATDNGRQEAADAAERFAGQVIEQLMAEVGTLRILALFTRGAALASARMRRQPRARTMRSCISDSRSLTTIPSLRQNACVNEMSVDECVSARS